MAQRPSRQPQDGADRESLPGPMLSVIDLVGLALLAVRWLTPTEGTFRGDTLWIAQLWLGWGVIAGWLAMREAVRWKRVTSPWTWGLVLLVVGHLLSGLVVVVAGGQKRAAVNGVWEWISLGLVAVWFQHRAGNPLFRRTFQIALISGAVGLSFLGIWQRWVTMPALGRAVSEYDELEGKLPNLAGGELRDAESRLRQLNQVIGPEYTGLDDAGRRAMRQRLLESTEPLGRFALANSLAAMLLVGLFLIAGEWVGRRLSSGSAVSGRSGALGLAVLSVLTVVIAFVLLLTKSRTAMVGACSGAVIAVTLSLRGRWRQVLYPAVLVCGGVGLLVVVTWAAGGLDALVVTEAPKSLEYRMEYWIGTWRVIADHPWLGVGPGNFRQSYLGHKLEKSSEEILDPHNFLLEAWVTGGLIALVGLLVVIAVTAAMACRGSQELSDADAATDRFSSAPTVLFLGLGILMAKEWLLDGLLDGELVATGAGAGVAAWGLNRLIPRGGGGLAVVMTTATTAAWFGLSVHLLGAGGMEMPAIIQMWLCLSSLVMGGGVGSERRDSNWWPTWLPMTVTGIGAAAFLGQMVTATTPALMSRALVHLAEADSLTGRAPDRILERLEEAAAADGLDPESWRRMAQFALVKWKQSQQDSDFERAVEAQKAAIARDPRNPHDQRGLADLYLARFGAGRRASDAEAAVLASRESLRLYPNQLSGRRVLAESLLAAGQTAESREAAQRTLELDQLWLELGHFDKVLTPAERERVKKLAGVE